MVLNTCIVDKKDWIQIELEKRQFVVYTCTTM